MFKIRYTSFVPFLAIFLTAVAFSQTSISPPSGLSIELLEEVPASSVQEVAPNSSQGGLSSSQANSPLVCYNPWDSRGMNLDNRVKRLLDSPYRTGFGGGATGGTKNLVVVTNPSTSGSGSFQDVLSKAKSGDYIVFHPDNDVYMNGCKGNGCKAPGSVTIDGSLSSGKYVTLRKRDDEEFDNSLRFEDGNNILTNILIDHGSLAAAVSVAHGENYWLDAFEIKAVHDDALGIGRANHNAVNSADMVTVSRYKVTGGPKGVLMLGGGRSCRAYPLETFDSVTDWGGGEPTDIAIDQRRAHVTIINSELAANTRNIYNNGGYADIIGSYIHGGAENTTTRYGGQTILRCSYIDSRDVKASAVRVDEGQFTVGKSKHGVRFCSQDSEIYLDNNVYIQPNFPSESSDPRIDVSRSHIRTGDGGNMTNGKDSWDNPLTGRAVFDRPYEENIGRFCGLPTPKTNAGPDFVVEDHCS